VRTLVSLQTLGPAVTLRLPNLRLQRLVASPAADAVNDRRSCAGRGKQDRETRLFGRSEHPSAPQPKDRLVPLLPTSFGAALAPIDGSPTPLAPRKSQPASPVVASCGQPIPPIQMPTPTANSRSDRRSPLMPIDQPSMRASTGRNRPCLPSAAAKPVRPFPQRGGAGTMSQPIDNPRPRPPWTRATP